MEVLTNVWKDYRADRIKENDIVVDIGSSEGYFSDWAKKRGAVVYSFDARNGLAVGPSDGFCEVRGQGLGAFIVPNKGNVKMISLASLLKEIGKDVDFLKCDIEGGEYLIFNCDLSRVNFIAMEFHVWTKEGDPLVEGLGVKNIEVPKNAVDKLIEFLSTTHKVEVVGDKEAGGYIFATKL